MKKRPPAAFMSYVRFDDEHEEGRLTEFRKRLSGEVRMQTGEEFPIFQDRNEIKWGQNWKQRIEESIDGVTFLIPIITPSFLKSPNCRAELKRFLEREKKLKRSDLILPVYYVDCPILNDPAKRAKDRLARVIAERQYADWRELRFKLFTSEEVGRTLAQLAVQVREALGGTSAPTGHPARRVTPKGRASAEEAAIGTPGGLEAPQAAQAPPEANEAGRTPSPKTSPPTLVVDPMHHGDHATITEAILAANPGDRILVRPGLYQEGLVVDKPLEVIGDGNPGEVIVQTTGQNALLFKTTMGRVANLTLRQMGGGEWFAVDIVQGRLELEDCDVMSQRQSCIAVHGGADPRLRRNRIHDGGQAGVMIYGSGRGTLEDNDISGNAHAGVAIASGGDPTVRRNRIHDGRSSGVFAYEDGKGTVEDNDIFANALSGVEIRTGANPIVRRNAVHAGGSAGVFVYESGRGILEDNDIFGNAGTGVVITQRGNPTLRRNRIHDGKYGGVLVHDNGQGTLEDNDIFANALIGVEISEGGNPMLRRNRINNNGHAAVRVHTLGAATIDDNDLRANARGPWDIAADCEANVKRARNLE